MNGYLTAAQAAELAGVKPRTWHGMVSRGTAPKPDTYLGRTPGWTRETVETWKASRPGPGWWGLHVPKTERGPK